MHILGLTFEDFDQSVGDKPSCYPVSDRIGKSHKNRSKESWNGLRHIILMDIFQTSQHHNPHDNENRCSCSIRNNSQEWAKEA